MGDGDKTVLVTDQSWSILEPTKPGKARILVKEEKASFVSLKPPMIQLNRNVERRSKMGIQTIADYFRENQDVFIQNVSGGVVSFTFYHEDGRPEPVSLPNDRRPFCLTNRIPVDLLKRSTDIRILAQRRPPAIRLLTRVEYEGMIEVIAKESGKTPDEVVSEAEEKIFQAQNKMTPTTPEEVKAAEKDTVTKDPRDIKTSDVDVPGVVEDDVNPRVMQLMASCSPDSDNRTGSQETIDQLRLINLSAIDLEYIKGNCSWKTVIAWAQGQKEAATARAAE